MVMDCEFSDLQGEEERVVARLALKQGLLNESQMQEAISCLRQEREQGRTVPFGDILIERGLLKSKQLDALSKASAFLKMRQPDHAFARVVIKNNFASQEDIDRAMKSQAALYKQSSLFKSIADILVEQGSLTPQQRKAIDSAIERSKKEKCGAHEEGRTVIYKDEDIHLLVSDNRMAAYLRIKEDASGVVDVARIKDLLQSNGIVHGLVDDALLGQYLKDGAEKGKLVQIARGRPAKPGKDAEIRLYFDERAASDPLEDMAENVDLKDRGGVPQVRKGDLLAEKIPAVRASEGMDIYGEVLRGQAAKDARILCGSGIDLSRDGTKAFAKTDGNPRTSLFGKISVCPELIIDGDVSFESGNVSFDGDIYVRGVVQDGFRIKGGSLRAREIGKAHVEVSGEVIVHGGILGAGIRSQGGVRAVHVHASRIEAMGDLVVDRGIVDSKVMLSGKCSVGRGKILSSSIIAKQGIEAYEVGSELSLPCSLGVGVDPIAEKEMAKIKEGASFKLKNKAKYEEMAEKLEKEFAQIEQKIGELAQEQDQALREKRKLSSKREEYLLAESPERVAQTDAMIVELDGVMAKVEEELEQLFERQDRAKEETAVCRTKIDEIKEDIDAINDELAAMGGWFAGKAARPAVKIYGAIFPGTVVKGLLSSLTLKEKAGRVLIEEVKSFDAGAESDSAFKAYMAIKRLRA